MLQNWPARMEAADRVMSLTDRPYMWPNAGRPECKLQICEPASFAMADKEHDGIISPSEAKVFFLNSSVWVVEHLLWGRNMVSGCWSSTQRCTAYM